MKRSRSRWLLVIFGLLLLLTSLAPGPQAGWAQTVPPPTPAEHPLYGDCDEEPGGTIGTVPPVFEPFLPNSIYVDWCGHALLTIAPPVGAAAGVHGFDPTVGHRIGLFYTTETTETGWSIARYSYRVDFTGFDDLSERQIALLRELCPQGNICNELLLAQIGKLGATWRVVNATGEHSITQPNHQLFMPYVSNEE
jgi:hypothetical protein